MKLGVVGSRNITSSQAVYDAIMSSPWKYTYQTIVTGGARGVDSIAESFAETHDFNCEVITPNWDDWSDGHPAKVRNTEIVEESDAIVAVWDGNSDGTRDTIDKAIDRGTPIYVEVVDD